MKKSLLVILVISCFLKLSGQPCSPNPYSMNFDGLSSYVAIPNAPALDITTQLTVEAWIKASQWATNSWSGSIVSKDGWSAGEFGYCIRAGGSGQLSFLIGGWNPNNTAASWQEVTSVSTAMSLNTWYHVAGTFDGNVVKVYLNGVQVDSLLFTGTILTSAGFPIRIGKYCDTVHGTRYWNGLIDEVRVWNVALSQAELQANMNMQLDTSLVHTGLVGYWRFNDGPGIVMHDVSGLHQDGTLFNGFPSTDVPFSNTPPPQPNITYSTGNLYSNSSGTFTYQWYLDGNLIPGATQSIFAPTQYGNYTVEIKTPGGCSSMSPVFTYNTTGIPSISPAQDISLNPDPAKDFVEIKAKSGIEQLEIYDLEGRKILSVMTGGADHYRLGLSTLKAGTYLLKGRTNQSFFEKKLIIL